jgi:dihydrofolate synthase/folylpolyglutamate synthase
VSTDAVLERLTLLHPKLIDLSLGRVRRLLAKLGHPERALPPVIHVAGTNGKGSVIANLRAMLEAAGYAVQAYTSPHLVRFSERVRLSNGLIGEDDLAALLEECEDACQDDPVTFFEITTAAAFLAFSRSPADVLLLEVGLGGRLDATNVVAQPKLCVIAPVSMDHMGFLGDTLTKIAAEKAGILKAGVPAVLGPQRSAAFDAIAAIADGIGAPLVPHARPDRNADWWWYETSERGLTVHAGGWSADLPHPALPGVHQAANAALAVTCLRRLDGFDVDEGAMAQGLSNAAWPARLQRLTGGPLADLLPKGAELWLDGGHNAAAGAALGETFAAWAGEDGAARPLYLVLGMMRTKDPVSFFAPLAPLTEQVLAVPIPGEDSSIEPDALADALSRTGAHATPHSGVQSALHAIACDAGPGLSPRVLICGSIYLAGDVLRRNGPPVT